MTNCVSRKTSSLFRVARRGKLYSLRVPLLLFALSWIFLCGVSYHPGNDAQSINNENESTAPNNNRLLLSNKNDDLRRANEEQRFNTPVSSWIMTSPPTIPVKAAPSKADKVNDERNTVTKRKTELVHDTKPTTRKNEVQKCCFRYSGDLNKEFTPKFFETIRTKDIQTEWSGNEYEEWLQLSSQLSSSKNDCKTQWTSLVLSQITYRGEYLRLFMTEVSQGQDGLFPFYPEQSTLPRVLFLGDSISRAIWVPVQRLYNRLGVVAMYGAPTNCRGIEEYLANLNLWLGSCSWDVVQFNVGMHFHPINDDWHLDYENGIRDIVSVIRAHSPEAKIIFALTTPSPFDSPATIPDEATCRNYHKLPKTGFVSAMNDIVRSLSTRLGILINDRYSVILPSLATNQEPCNIHFQGQGYRMLARHDWKFLSSQLNISVPGDTRTKRTTSTAGSSTSSTAIAAIRK